VVQNSGAQDGSQGLSIEDAVVSHAFLGTPTNIWIEFWAKPVRAEAIGVVDEDSAAVFCVNTNDQLVAYNSTNPIVVTSPTVSDDWNKFAIHCDYDSKVWNLELNGGLVVSNFAFYGSAASFNTLKITEASTNAALIDTILVSDSLADFAANIIADTSSLSVPEGGNNTYQIKLSEQPLSNIVVTTAYQSGDTDLSVTGGGRS